MKKEMLLRNCFSFRLFTKNSGDNKGENSDDTHQNTKAYFIQFTSILTGYILVLDAGAHFSWSSPALSHFRSDKSQFSITTDQGAWLASITSLGTIVGYMINSIIINRIGRRYSILIFAISHLISWILINVARSFTFLIIARLTAGLSYAGSGILLPICIGEISEKNIRGSFLTFDRIGFIAIQAYAQEIFRESGSSLAPEYATMIITGVQIFAGLPSTQLIDHWGRRPVLLFSGITSAISLGIISLFFFLKDFLKIDVSSVTWLPLAGLILYQCMCSFGISTISTVFEGELFSVKVKNIAVMIASNSSAVFMITPDYQFG
ncbi:facilitated trehalose transporter Tret1-like [Belonocnema kinseyi]|uniref:facilitated trehalose transporter Tret1-like n=1 Tax=Belonocnema kinseyi TaxID=2817044 RepID=UPI00143DB762|nr:facilitated trehalose transporter Tret1-like [Belonocnema kinseyi]